jgi:hypothetical protein
MIYKCSLTHQTSNMELRTKLDALQALTVATTNWMLYKCSLSQQDA